MKEIINRTLIHALDGYNSHLPAKTVLEGLTAKVSGSSLPGAPYTIWQLIGHINFWQVRFIAHLKGQKLTEVPLVEDGWPYDKSPADEGELKAVIKALLDGIAEVRQLLERGADLKHPPNYDSGFDVVTSMATHLSYHLGQVMTLRRMLGDYPPPSGSYIW
ncbi:DinB family protein [Fulvivirga kasyanovii]|uniref:DinB family protein n=1 Tax=Fulvivirga kasyanovii TaxID=396812 RepID=A0ABW9RUX0_9BACT|nr:DinB family protein [Fulvivirga kasyanovii]MTI26790.1 DinB family protein [Fulvivirga kasyanovii]